MLKKSLIVFIIALAGLLIYQMISRTSSRAPAVTEKSTYEYEEDDFHNELLTQFLLDTAIIAKSHKSDDISLKSLNHNNALFVRYSVNGCAHCIKTLFKELNSLKDKNDSVDIIMLLKNIGRRDLYVNWVSHDKKFQMYQMDYIPLDTIASPDSPYLFRMDNNGLLSDHFICQYGDEYFLNKYLNNL